MTEPHALLQKTWLAYTILEAAEALRISKSKLYEIIKAQEIRTCKLGHRTVVRREELIRYLDAAEAAMETGPEHHRSAA